MRNIQWKPILRPIFGWQRISKVALKWMFFVSSRMTTNFPLSWGKKWCIKVHRIFAYFFRPNKVGIVAFSQMFPSNWSQGDSFFHYFKNNIRKACLIKGSTWQILRKKYEEILVKTSKRSDVKRTITELFRKKNG